MKKALIYGSALLFSSCGGKSGGVSQPSPVKQETQEKIPDRLSSVTSEPFFIDYYKGSDWITPDTLSAVLQKEPEASSLKNYIPDSICRKQVDGVERCFYEDTLMNGAYSHLYFLPTDAFVSEPCYSVAVYKDGIKNDTVNHYSHFYHCLTSRKITLDSIREVYQSYHTNGQPYIFYQVTRGKLDGVRQRWNFDGKPDWFEHYKDGELHGEEMKWYPNGHLLLVNHYIDGKEVYPKEYWYSTRNDY